MQKAHKYFLWDLKDELEKVQGKQYTTWKLDQKFNDVEIVSLIILHIYELLKNMIYQMRMMTS